MICFFNVASDATLTIKDLTLKNGHGVVGGAISVFQGETLVATNVRFEGNKALIGGGVLVDGLNVTMGGEAIFDTCAFDSNSATSGGGVYVAKGKATFTDCDFSSNEATYYGGGCFPREDP